MRGTTLNRVRSRVIVKSVHFTSSVASVLFTVLGALLSTYDNGGWHEVMEKTNLHKISAMQHITTLPPSSFTTQKRND